MKMIAFLLATTLVGLIKGQGTDCDFDYICDASTSLEVLEMAAPSATACYDACRASMAADGTTPNCEFWTYYEELGIKTFGEDNGTEFNGADGKMKATGKEVCLRLADCDTQLPKTECDKANRKNCASGPRGCEPCDKCLPLNYEAGATKAHWTCETNMPYMKQNFAPGSQCWTECPSTADPGKWTATEAEATCTSTCNDATPGTTGNWVLATEVSDAIPGILSPIKDSDCLCANIVLGPHQLPEDNGATTEEGARFRCKSSLVTGDSGKADTMDSTSRCQLFCNNHLAMDIRCVAGSWTDGVTSNEEIYCWGPPLACDYNPGINMDVCTCSNVAGDTTEICAAEQACNDGVCETACIEKPEVTGADCFCQGKTGGVTCTADKICNDWECI